MAQVKIYGLRERLAERRPALSAAIHQALMEALQLPQEKRFQRFFPLAPEDFLFPADRSRDYLIVEISMFEGRGVETKKALIRALYRHLEPLGIAAADLEITIVETPRHNWGIRGLPGDELALNYKVEI